MPIKQTGPAAGFREIDRWAGGVGWIAHPDEELERASHALAVGGSGSGDADVWVVDPVDADGIDEMLAELGEVAGVVVLLDRHYRDAEAFARRHGVPLFVPSWFPDPEVSVPVRRFDETLADTGYRVLKVVDLPGWNEAALYGDDDTLVVAEAVGTIPFFTTDEERLGVHPMVRLFPPKVLRGRNPERILVGHGPGVFEDAPETLRDALDGSRRRYPKLLARTARSMLPL